MAWKGPEPVGQVIGWAGIEPLEVGKTYTHIMRDYDGTPAPSQPIRVLRQATREEWLAERPDRAAISLHARLQTYYLVSTD